MCVNGITLFPVDIHTLDDREPIFIEFDNDNGGVFTSQWGIVDQKRKVTIHKDFTLSFNDKCKYYGLHAEEEKNEVRTGVIVKFCEGIE